MNDIQAIMSITPQENMDGTKLNENNVIDSYEAAESVFTTKYLYCNAHMRKFREECGGCSQAELTAQRKVFAELFENENDNVKKAWEAERRAYLKLQPKVKGQLIDSLRQNNSMSYEALADNLEMDCYKRRVLFISRKNNSSFKSRAKAQTVDIQ